MNSDMSSQKAGRARMWLLVALVVIMTGWALRATGAFMVPVVSSVFLALLVAPLDRKVADSVPDRISWLGHVAAMAAIVVSLLVFVGMIWIAAQQVVERFPFPSDSASLLPEFGQEIRGQSEDASSETRSEGLPANMPADVEPDVQSGESQGIAQGIVEFFSGAGGSMVDRLGSWASGIAMDVLSAASTALFATVLVIFLTLLMLIETPRWRQKIGSVADASTRQDVMESAAVISRLLRRYLVARTILGVITAVLYVTWLWIFGVDLLVVWALLTFVLNYIPTLGSLISGALPVLYAVVQKDPGTAIFVGIGIFAIEQIIGNYVDPRVQGRQVSLSSLVVLITLLVWGWIWGIAGAILAVPITIAAMITCAHIASLRPFALMLSNESDFESLDERASEPRQK